MREVMNYLSDNKKATAAELEELLGVKHTRLYNLTREMKELGLIHTDGRGKNKKYLTK